jgi:DNA polymerase I-like protein with 3'-5' exonuclease and polymerase domains
MGQGSARDITMEVLIRLITAHPEYRQYLRIYVHDEFVFSVPENMAEEVGAEIEAAFTWEWNGVPILCDRTAPAENWGLASAK